MMPATKRPVMPRQTVDRIVNRSLALLEKGQEQEAEEWVTALFQTAGTLLRLNR